MLIRKVWSGHWDGGFHHSQVLTSTSYSTRCRVRVLEYLFLVSFLRGLMTQRLFFGRQDFGGNLIILNPCCLAHDRDDQKNWNIMNSQQS